MHYKPSVGSRIFDVLNYLILSFCALVTLLPFVYILAVSFAPLEQVLKGGIILWPKRFTFDAYQLILSSKAFLHALRFTVLITVVGTSLNVLITAFMAYPLSKKQLKGRETILFLVFFTMLFSGGMIPGYMVVRETHLMNTMWSLIVPGLVSAFNLIVMKNFFQTIPQELEEAAQMDGLSTFGILLRIVLPLSLPALATFTLFYSVGHWNSFFNAILYNSKSSLWPIQVILRQIVLQSSIASALDTALSAEIIAIPLTIQMAAIIVATMPILVVYPYLQKHFAKGVLLGSIKG